MNDLEVYGLTRVSSEGQLKEGGLDRQDRTIRRFCEKQSWKLMFIASEQARRGTTDFGERIALQELVNIFSEKTGRKIIVVENAGRLARDLLIQESILNTCRDLGIEVWSADGSINLVDDPGDPLATAIRQMMGVFMQLDKSSLVLKLRAGRDRKKENGTGGIEGNRPYGTLEDEKPVIQLICFLHFRYKHTPRLIAADLNGMGSRRRKGGPWTPRVVDLVLKNREARGLREDIERFNGSGMTKRIEELRQRIRDAYVSRTLSGQQRPVAC